MESQEIRKRFLAFFEKRGHAIIPSASLVAPDESEKTNKTLFISAGMQPLIPYLLGKDHPKGKRLANVQKSVRTQDIEEVGDKTHDTFFEMLGNWSLGDYFKEDAIKWSYELLTDKEEGFGLDPNRLYITVFAGDENAPRDNEAAEIWKKYIPENRIYFLPADKNWWSAGDNGPSGPDTEMYYDITPEGLGDLTHEEFLKADNEQKIVEIWNDVFMEYEKKDGKVVGKLPSRNVDTGAGLERLAMVLQKKDSIFDTDLFISIMSKIDELKKSSDIRSERIVADHIRTSVFIIADHVIPANTDKGYVLRRIIRRAVRYADKLGVEMHAIGEVIDLVTNKYRGVYDFGDEEYIREVILEEEHKFRKTLEKGLKILHRKIEAQIGRPGQTYKVHHVSLVHGPDDIQMWDFPPSEVTGKWLFDFYQTFGFPFEMTLEELKSHNKHYFFPQDYKRLQSEFNQEIEKHRELSRAGAEQKFKGGLAGHSDVEVKYHTTTHLLHQALRDVLGPEVQQEGSNITPERLRFDFAFPRKMTDEEKLRVEDIVNKKIKEAIPVQNVTMDKNEAIKSGALHFFDQKYPDQVSVYSIGTYSKELCGGPHVSNTSELGIFKIQKEEAVSVGVRRIKAVLQ
ncbi:alanine--tRNA ligase [Candidatus Parcubacteria bacterium]|nr:alanine--tRNA ligase [Candidatus Parcubacteria bacterium]